MYFGPEPPIHEAPMTVHIDSWIAGWKLGWERGTMDEANARRLYSQKLTELKNVIEAFDGHVEKGILTDEEAMVRIGRIFYRRTMMDRFRKVVSRAR